MEQHNAISENHGFLLFQPQEKNLEKQSFLHKLFLENKAQTGKTKYRAMFSSEMQPQI